MSNQDASGNAPDTGPPAPAPDDPSEASLPAPAPAAEDAGKQSFFEHAETLGKLATLALGVLYVFGILIANIQLMDLGISDFASLQARNVLTGFFFVIYFLWFLLVLAPIVVAVTSFYSWWPKIPFGWQKIGTAVLIVAVCGFYFFIFMTLGNWAFGHIYPWANPDTTLGQFALTYAQYYGGTLIAGFLLVLMAGILTKLSQEKPDLRVRTVLIVFGVTTLVIVPLVMSDYANEIYPNVKYNAGGGQPRIAAIVLAGKKSEMAGAELAGLPASAVCCEASDPEQSVKTDAVAVWYQSDKFIYLSNLANIHEDSSVPAQVAAIDMKLVRKIDYLPRYVEIHHGNAIARVYEGKPDGTAQVVSRKPAPAAPIVWAQLHPDETANPQLVARAIVESGGACPIARFDGGSAAMTERWSRADGPFPVKICEIVYAASLKATIGDTVLKPRPSDPKKIVVIGDTGCRIAKWGMQDCNDPDEWPFRKVAAQAAAHEPELIIHVGDYQYREACLEADAGKCAGLALGDVWPAWRKDFFAPAGRLLAAAPWVMLRGNHEDMGRAGAGWLRLFAPFPRTAGEDALPDDVRPYVLRFPSLTLAILDVANEKEKSAAPVRGELYRRWLDRLAARLPIDPARPNWLFLHVPMWVSHGCTGADCRQAADPAETLHGVRERLRHEPRTFDLVFGGDTHMFQLFVPEDRRIAPQIIAGMSGTLLEAKIAYHDAALDKPVNGPLFDVAGKLWMHRGFGYLVLTKGNDGAWSAAFYDPDGDKPVFTCNLAAAALDRAQADFPCK